VVTKWLQKCFTIIVILTWHFDLKRFTQLISTVPRVAGHKNQVYKYPTMHLTLNGFYRNTVHV